VSRRFTIPEVVQTSAMDCGPASLAALLAGFDVPANYAHLREVCQTDVDGTSIDTLEDVARASGLDAEQVMLPVDQAFEPSAQALPALTVVRLPGGNTHFVVLWRRVGRLVQVMDPAHGRSWQGLATLERRLYRHQQAVDPADVMAWFAGDENLAVQRARLARLGVGRDQAGALLDAAVAAGWRSCARLDGAVRMVAELVTARALPRRAAPRLVAGLAVADGPAIPDRHLAMVAGQGDEVILRGVVLVRCRDRGPPAADAGADAAATPPTPAMVALGAPASTSPARELVRLIRREPASALFGLGLMLVIAGGALAFEALVLRGLLGLVEELDTGRLRALAVGVVLALLAALLVFDVSLRAVVAGVGRRLELALRIGFLERLPALKDRYFRTRLTSDLAQRAHAVHTLRALPEVMSGLARAWIEVALLGVALAWLAPDRWRLAVAAVALAIGLPLLVQRHLREVDLRARTHAGALSRFFLDALLGVAPIRAHRAEPAVAREHESLLVDWLAASRRFVALQVAVDAALFVACFVPLVALVALELAARPVDGSALLLVYWAISLPQRAAIAAQHLAQTPGLRNTALRLAEPLASADPIGAATPPPAGGSSPATDGASPDATAPGVAIELEDVTVSAGGHTLLHGIHLSIAPGEHIAVVGPSGAGKSSLVGLLLGFHEPSSGALRVDGRPLDAAALDALRGRTAWVDPAVQLWSDGLYDNLLYGAPADGAAALPAALDRAALREVIEVLPGGLQTPLGESGRLLSGGQGQRVRLGRAMVRSDARLVLLDEPFRGLDRPARERLLTAARAHFAGATLLHVTHDVSHALELSRVLVIEGGQVVEDGAPAALAAAPGSRFAALLAAERAVHRTLWGDTRWRRIRIGEGAAREEG
jgi:ABC-type bacteriocin/lantibiotic exporter with double-glycine peptidase domain